MNTLALGISLAGFVIIMGSWIIYFASIPRHQVPVRPAGSVISQCFGMCLAVYAMIGPYQVSGISAVAMYIFAALALMMGLFFLWLLSQRKTPTGDLKVKVGDQLLPFEAMTSEGEKFHTDALSKKRVLLKFFRGGW